MSLGSSWGGLGGTIRDSAMEGLIFLEFLVRIIHKQERAGVREAMIEVCHIGPPDLLTGSHVLTRHPQFFSRRNVNSSPYSTVCCGDIRRSHMKWYFCHKAHYKYKT